jgi:hypothetical protein
MRTVIWRRPKCRPQTRRSRRLATDTFAIGEGGSGQEGQRQRSDATEASAFMRSATSLDQTRACPQGTLSGPSAKLGRYKRGA